MDVKLRLFDIEMNNGKYNYASTHAFLLWFVQVSRMSPQLLQKSIQLTPLRAQVHLCVAQIPESVLFMLIFTCDLKDGQNLKPTLFYQYVQDCYIPFLLSLGVIPTLHTKCISLLMSLGVPPPTFRQSI